MAIKDDCNGRLSSTVRMNQLQLQEAQCQENLRRCELEKQW